MKIDAIYTMRYMGSKNKLLDFIVPKIEGMINDGEKVLDLMSGTHAVGYALKARHPIVANDIQKYSSIIGEALIENNDTNLSIEDINNDIISNIENNISYKLFQDNYTDTYFSSKQCADIDAIRFAIDKVKDEHKKAIYLTGLMYAMGYCQSSSGHFAQYMPKDHPRIINQRKLSIINSFVKWVKDENISFSKYKNIVLNEDYRVLFNSKKRKKLLSDVKLVYIDPPYSEAQYSRFYHLLETAVKYDYPKTIFKGLYRDDRFQSNFCYRSKVEAEFDYLIKKVHSIGSKVAISYSNKGIVKIDGLIQIVKRYYGVVDIFYREYNHSMQGRGVSKDVTEVLITGQ